MEKRKALVYKAAATTYFGLEGCDAGLTVFGSKNVYGGAAPAQATALPSPFVYQQLKHPAVSVFGIAYDASYHEMTAVRSSQPYLGKAVVLATYADGYTFLFYDGTPVLESYSGIVLHGYTYNTAGTPGAVATLNQDMVNGFLSINGWYGVPGLPIAFGVTASAVLSLMDIVTTSSFPGKVSGCIIAPTATTWSTVKTLTSTNGKLEFNFGATTLAAAPGTAATLNYTVAGGGGTQYDIYLPVTASADIQFWAARNINWGVDNPTTARALRDAINDNTARHGFTATASGAVLTINAPIPLLTTLGPWPTPQPAYSWNPMIIRTNVGTSVPFTNGVSATPLLGQYDYFMFNSGWAENDTWSVNVTAGSTEFTIGRGNLGTWKATNTPAYPASMLTFNTQVLLANGNYFNFSQPGDPTGWEQQDTNAGFLPFTSQHGAQDVVQAFCSYQTQLAVFGRYSVQVWNWNADPDSQSKSQTLANIGTIAPFSVLGLGDLDVMFLADTGIRSLRAKVTSNNAFVNDIGSPVDALVTPTATACAGVDPLSGRYWLYTNGTIYVLSYYPTNKIVAWSTYLPKVVTSSYFDVTFTDDMLAHSSITVSAYDGWTTNTVGSIIDVSVGQTIYAAATLLAADINGRTLGYTAVDNGDGSVTVTYTGYVSNVTSLVVGTAPNTIGAVTETFTTKTLQKFITYQGRLYARCSDSILCYGGATGTVYDTTQAVVTTPWLDAGKPDTAKGFNAIDGVVTGSWQMQFGTDWIDESFQTVIAAMTNSTFDQGAVGFTASATHFAFKLTSTALQAPATIAQVIALYQPQNEPA